MAELDPELLQITLRLLLALGLGASVGVERTFRGRPAGFRTHALVGLSTCMLMLVPVYEGRWWPPDTEGRVVLDPTRMAQGVMTGIGFLGAGSILREGFTVRGLTTAASLWLTAAIGILVGIGFFFPALLGVGLTLGTLSGFRWFEAWISTPSSLRLRLRFAREDAPSEPELRRLLAEQGFSSTGVSCRGDREHLEYQLDICSRTVVGTDALAAWLRSIPNLAEFRIASVG